MNFTKKFIKNPKVFDNIYLFVEFLILLGIVLPFCSTFVFVYALKSNFSFDNPLPLVILWFSSGAVLLYSMKAYGFISEKISSNLISVKRSIKDELILNKIKVDSNLVKTEADLKKENIKNKLKNLNFF